MLLNVKGMAQFWYLATVIPIPKWFIRPIENYCFDFCGRERVEPIKREIIYLPVENGGLGLLEPNLQQKALRLRFLQNIVKPLMQNQVGDSGKVLDWVPMGTYKYSTRQKYLPKLLW